MWQKWAQRESISWGIRCKILTNLRTKRALKKAKNPKISNYSTITLSNQRIYESWNKRYSDHKHWNNLWKMLRHHPTKKRQNYNMPLCLRRIRKRRGVSSWKGSKKLLISKSWNLINSKWVTRRYLLLQTIKTQFTKWTSSWCTPKTFWRNCKKYTKGDPCRVPNTTTRYLQQVWSAKRRD